MARTAGSRKILFPCYWKLYRIEDMDSLEKLKNYYVVRVKVT